jgi:two-component system sensor histidine kinase HydH
MQKSKRDRNSWIGVPPWVLIGAAAVLLPILTVMTLANINRQRGKSIQLLLEKGAALIRSFEAGTRMGMMRMHRQGFRLQQLLTETAQQPDIIYLFVIDIHGEILAHNDLDRIGSNFGRELDLKKISRQVNLSWRQLTHKNGSRIFEVFRKFSPTRKSIPREHRRMMFDRRPGPGRKPAREHVAPPLIIFVGLDMSAVDAAQKADIRHAIIMGIILLLVGFAGIALLFMLQSYRTTRASLSRIKAFSDNLVENIPVGLLALDYNKKIATFNHVAESVLQLSSANVIGRKAQEVISADLMALIEQPEIQADIIEREIAYPIGNGDIVPLEAGASLLKDENGAFLGYVVLFKDLTEVQALRREIARSQRLASVGRLAAGVAHEIRNPLSSIKGFATYFKERYPHAPQDQQTADIMIHEVERLNRVVGQLLEFARPVPVAYKRTSLSALVKDSIRLIEKQAQEKEIKLCSVNNAQVDEVNIDPDRINQILLNLYLNAIESMEVGGILCVEFSNIGKNQQIEIRISDTGCGIKPEDVSKVFDPYFTTKASGTGLGLAIAHNIVEALGGQIEIESRLGQGTNFILIIPVIKKK